MKKIISFEVEAKAIAKERPRKGRHGFYTPVRTANFEKLIKLEAMKHFKDPFEGPIALGIEIFIKSSAKSLYGKPKTTRPDADNYLKAISDSLNGVAYKDDAQVFKMEISKYWADKDYILIQVEEF